MMPKELTTTIYQTLFDAISAIYIKANAKTKKAVRQIRMQAFWEIGKTIVTEMQKNRIRAQYGDKLLKNLAKGLTKKFGKGFTETNLYYMREFYLTHPSISHAREKLSWTQQRTLLAIKD